MSYSTPQYTIGSSCIISGYTALGTSGNPTISNSEEGYNNIMGLYNDVIGRGNTILDSNKCLIVGNNNTIPNGANGCVVIGNNITLTEDCELNDILYIGNKSKVFFQIRGEFVDIAEKLADLEDKINMLLYSPGGPMFEAAKHSFESHGKII